MIQPLLPESIVCVESSLFHYGYSNFAPRTWTLAVPRAMTKTKINMDVITFKPYYILFDGATIPVYDREQQYAIVLNIVLCLFYYYKTEFLVLIVLCCTPLREKKYTTL